MLQLTVPHTAAGQKKLFQLLLAEGNPLSTQPESNRLLDMCDGRGQASDGKPY